MKASYEQNVLYEIIQVPETTRVRFWTSVDSGSYVTSHWHPAIEIIYMQEGELTITLESATHVLTVGQCMLINANQIHSTKCTRPNSAIVLQIPLEFMETYIPTIRQMMFFWDCITDNSIQQTKLERLKETLTQMQIANDIRPDGFLLRFNSLLFELMFQLYHNFRVQVLPSVQNRRSQDLNRLNPILQYTAEHYNEPITTSEIAQIAYLQPGYFCRFFKKCMGVTFLEYQNELRLARIYHDLMNTDDSIHEILSRHGFSNYKLFRRMFREHFGSTPSEVRKAGRELPSLYS